MNNYSGNETVNAGTGKELTIKEIEEKIAELVEQKNKLQKEKETKLEEEKSNRLKEINDMYKEFKDLIHKYENDYNVRLTTYHSLWF